MAGTGTMSARATKRREITMMWMKQLLEAQEKQGTAKAAAAAWIGAVYALRAASRLDGNADWGKVGDEMIGNLESVYLDLFGKEGEKAIEAGRRLLQTHEKPQLTIAKIPKIKKPAAVKKPVLRKPLFKRPLLSRAAAMRKIEAAKVAVAKEKALAKVKAKGKAKAPKKAKAAKKSGKGKKGKR
jgi:hypothetical protein